MLMNPALYCRPQPRCSWVMGAPSGFGRPNTSKFPGMCHYDGVNVNSVAVDESASGSEVVLAVGQTLQVRLPENRVTGYRWMLEEAGAPACALVGDTFQAAAGAI